MTKDPPRAGKSTALPLLWSSAQTGMPASGTQVRSSWGLIKSSISRKEIIAVVFEIKCEQIPPSERSPAGEQSVASWMVTHPLSSVDASKSALSGRRFGQGLFKLIGVGSFFFGDYFQLK